MRSSVFRGGFVRARASVCRAVAGTNLNLLEAVNNEMQELLPSAKEAPKE